MMLMQLPRHPHQPDIVFLSVLVCRGSSPSTSLYLLPSTHSLFFVVLAGEVGKIVSTNSFVEASTLPSCCCAVGSHSVSPLISLLWPGIVFGRRPPPTPFLPAIFQKISPPSLLLALVRVLGAIHTRVACMMTVEADFLLSFSGLGRVRADLLLTVGVQ